MRENICVLEKYEAELGIAVGVELAEVEEL